MMKQNGLGSFRWKIGRILTLCFEKQIYAIENGDANTYRDLCTDDILLMLQGNDIVFGKSDFYEGELKLFQKVDLCINPADSSSGRTAG